MDWNHQHWNNSRTETSTVSHWIGHLLACMIGHHLFNTKTLYTKSNAPIALEIGFVNKPRKLGSMTNRLGCQRFAPSNQIYYYPYSQ